ncbi:hypothetical protein A2U01_0061492, partial [Trifolium medium]|nr:hypothetical protein [Trifolium medium]
GSSLGAGLHRLQPGVPAGDFVLPPTFGHTKLFDGQTKVVIPDDEKAILDGMGPEALKNEIADSSISIFKLLEVVNYLNGRECQYLRERDIARKKANDLGQKLSEMKVSFDDYKNKYALQ